MLSGEPPRGCSHPATAQGSSVARLYSSTLVCRHTHTYAHRRFPGKLGVTARPRVIGKGNTRAWAKLEHAVCFKWRCADAQQYRLIRRQVIISGKKERETATPAHLETSGSWRYAPPRSGTVSALSESRFQLDYRLCTGALEWKINHGREKNWQSSDVSRIGLHAHDLKMSEKISKYIGRFIIISL